MKTASAINKLNEVQITREKLIDRIIYKKHKPKGDHEWDKLTKKYSKYGYQELLKLDGKQE